MNKLIAITYEKVKGFFSKITFSIYLKLGKFLVDLENFYKKHSKVNNPLIKIGKSYIHPDARLELIEGGNISIGDATELLNGVVLMTYGGNISIGNNCSISPYTIICGHGGTKIGNNVLIAGHCLIIPNSHNYMDPNRTISEQGSICKGIVIEDDVWIGHGCSILDGVTLGKGSVIGAGSVVNRSVPPYSVFGGVPAKYIKKRG